MSRLTASFKGHFGFRMSEEGIIAVLGKIYSDPGKTGIKDFYNILRSDNPDLDEQWRNDLIGPIIKKIAEGKPQSEQRKRLLSELCTYRAMVQLRTYQYTLDPKYQTAFLASYPPEDPAMPLAAKVGKIVHEMCVFGMVYPTLLEIAVAAYGMNASKIEAQTNFLQAAYEVFLKFQTAVTTLHVTAPQTFEVEDSAAAATMAIPTINLMLDEIAKLDQMVGSEAVNMIQAKRVMDRLYQLQSDFFEGTFGMSVAELKTEMKAAG